MSRNARRGIFFDLDGVLADGLDAMRQVFAEFAAAFGHDASDEEFAAVNGMPVPVLVAGLKRDWTLPEKLHELLAHYDALIDARAFDTAQASYNLLNPSPGAALPAGYPAQDYANLLGHAAAADMGVLVIRVLAAGALSGTEERHPLNSPPPAPIGSGLVPPRAGVGAAAPRSVSCITWLNVTREAL